MEQQWGKQRALEDLDCLPSAAWEVFYHLWVTFPKESISAARPRQGSSRDRACWHHEVEKLNVKQTGYTTPGKRINAEDKKAPPEIYSFMYRFLVSPPNPKGSLVGSSIAPLTVPNFVTELRKLSKKSNLEEWPCKKVSCEPLLHIKRQFNPYISGKSRWPLLAMTPKAIKTKRKVGIHLSFVFLAARAIK